MGDRPKIHLFLGAPPPCGSGVPSDAGAAGGESAPSRWRELELTWQDGQLLPAAAAAGSGQQNSKTDQSGLQVQGDETNSHQEVPCSQDNWTTKTSQAQEVGITNGCGSLGGLTPERLVSPGEEFTVEEEAQDVASVREYLDVCFPAAQLQQTEPTEPEPPQCSEKLSPRASPTLSTHTQYLATWTLSHALNMRARCGIQSATSPEKTPPPQTPAKHVQTSSSISSSTPELFSSATPSPRASVELFSPPQATPRVEEGGVVLEVTADGMLCSQEVEQQESKKASESPTTSPDFKKARTEATVLDSNATTGLQGPTTLLVCCDKPGVRYQVLVAVVHPCHVKEIKVKSGPTAGTLVPLASIVVTDQSGVEMKVVMWRRAAFWTLTVNPGDILLITGLQLIEDQWRGETLLQSTFSSKLLNLGQMTGSASPPALHHVHAHALNSLCGFLREWRPLLASLPLRLPQDLTCLPYVTLRSLRVNTLVHALLRVRHVHIGTAWRREAESRCRSALQQQAVVTVEQPDGQQGVLLLWGAAYDWLRRFNRDKAAVWNIRVLLVRQSSSSDVPELHSTPWSSARPLDATDRRAQDFLRRERVVTGNSSSLELDLDTLLSQKYTGDVELRVQVFAFRFQDTPPSQNAQHLVLDSSTSPACILAALSGDITYTGCGCCTAELDTDANGIYNPCYPCLPHTAVRRYFRPGVLTVGGSGNSRACVQVPPVPLQKILNAPPDKLRRSSAPGSDVKHIQVAAERIQTLLVLPRKTFAITVRSLFLCDENSVPVTQDFTLLDLQFPA
ncbi:shieldin complex subunit 2 [Aulostomus maculatus]